METFLKAKKNVNWSFQPYLKKKSQRELLKCSTVGIIAMIKTLLLSGLITGIQLVDNLHVRNVIYTHTYQKKALKKPGIKGSWNSLKNVTFCLFDWRREAILFDACGFRSHRIMSDRELEHSSRESKVNNTECRTTRFFFYASIECVLLLWAYQ